VTGEFAGIHAALQEAKGAVRRAQDHVRSDDKVQAVRLLEAAEECCRRARLLAAGYQAPQERAVRWKSREGPGSPARG